MKRLKWKFSSKYKKLLEQIRCAQINKQRLHLENGVVLDFVPGSDYNFPESEQPMPDSSQSFLERYYPLLGQVVNMDVYDCFGGDVRILAIGTDRVFIEIVEAYRCYSCQVDPLPGEKYWVSEWMISDIGPNRNWVLSDKEIPETCFSEEDLPF